MVIRKAEINDLVGLQGLYLALRPNDPSLSIDEAHRILKSVIDDVRTEIFVAECDGTLASTCMLSLIPNFANGGRPIGIIEHVVTLDAFKGQGLAKAVLHEALGSAWYQGACKVLLLSGTQRADAHKLYEAVGFDGVSERGFVIKSPGV